MPCSTSSGSPSPAMRTVTCAPATWRCCSINRVVPPPIFNIKGAAWRLNHQLRGQPADILQPCFMQERQHSAVVGGRMVEHQIGRLDHLNHDVVGEGATVESDSHEQQPGEEEAAYVQQILVG